MLYIDYIALVYQNCQMYKSQKGSSLTRRYMKVAKTYASSITILNHLKRKHISVSLNGPYQWLK